MNTYWKSEGKAPCILNFVLHGGEWSVSSHGRFIPGEITRRTHWIGGWVIPRAGPDAVSKRKIPNPYRESNLDRPARSIVTAIELCRFPLLTYLQNILVPKIRLTVSYAQGTGLTITSSRIKKLL